MGLRLQELLRCCGKRDCGGVGRCGCLLLLRLRLRRLRLQGAKQVLRSAVKG